MKRRKDIWSELLIPYQGLEFSSFSNAMTRAQGIAESFRVVTGLQRAGEKWIVLVTPDTVGDLAEIDAEHAEYWAHRDDVGAHTAESEAAVREESDLNFWDSRDYLGADDWE